MLLACRCRTATLASELACMAASLRPGRNRRPVRALRKGLFCLRSRVCKNKHFDRDVWEVGAPAASYDPSLARPATAVVPNPHFIQRWPHAVGGFWRTRGRRDALGRGFARSRRLLSSGTPHALLGEPACASAAAGCLSFARPSCQCDRTSRCIPLLLWMNPLRGRCWVHLLVEHSRQ